MRRSDRTVDYDMVIAGGGMVGAALCCALGASGLRIALIEAHAPKPFKIASEADLRVVAVNRASQTILAALGVWQGISAVRVSPYHEMHVWDAGGTGSVHFSAAAIGETDLGHIVENNLIQHVLWERLRTFNTVTVLCPARISAIEAGADCLTLQLDNAATCRTRVLAAADGAASHTRKLLDMPVMQAPYAQQAVVAAIRTAQPHRQTAWQRFLPDGPLALLPLSDGQCSIVWSTSPEQAQQLLALDDTAFCAALTEASEAVLGEVQTVSRRAAFPLQHLHARDYVRPRVALLGDAAHVVHPLAGQGVNLGLLDAAVLAEEITRAREAGEDPGALRVLKRYARRRQGENLAMGYSLDGFKRLFGQMPGPVAWLRNAGMRMFNRSGPLKQIAIRRAMGLSGDLPALARVVRD